MRIPRQVPVDEQAAIRDLGLAQTVGAQGEEGEGAGELGGVGGGEGGEGVGGGERVCCCGRRGG